VEVRVDGATVDASDARGLVAGEDERARLRRRRRSERVLDSYELRTGLSRMGQRAAGGPAAKRVLPRRVLRARPVPRPDPDQQADPAANRRSWPGAVDVLAVRCHAAEAVDVGEIALR